MRGDTREGSARSVETVASGIARPRWSARAQRFCRKALREFGAERWEISILFCDDATIAQLNERYRGIARPTDVLSFPRSGGPGWIEGDIAVSCDALRRNADAFGVSEDDELKRLLVHGMLHLAGMDHGRGKGRRMFVLQERIVETLRAEIIIPARYPAHFHPARYPTHFHPARYPAHFHDGEGAQ